jgi:tRNA1(Val) A37 N6-methylase TrmN6
MAEQHFTSVSVARRAAAFLVQESGTRVLDIGSGAGKFCLIGAATTSGHFTGVEQREDLVAHSAQLAGDYRVERVSFIQGNVMAIDFKAFDAFYMFNPFYENLRADHRIDNAILLNPSLYDSYSSYTKSKLATLPVETRLATYFTSASMIPPEYKKLDSFEDGKLVFWKKRD